MVFAIIAFACAADYTGPSYINFMMWTGVSAFVLALALMAAYACNVTAVRGGVELVIDVIWSIFWCAACICRGSDATCRKGIVTNLCVPLRQALCGGGAGGQAELGLALSFEGIGCVSALSLGGGMRLRRLHGSRLNLLTTSADVLCSQHCSGMPLLTMHLCTGSLG